MGVRLRFRGGTLAGKAWEFDDDVEAIVVGRDPEHCQVVVPEEMVSIGRQHFGLKRSLGRYRLVLNRDNPVYLDGKEALDGTELPEAADLRLGKDGPQLTVLTLLGDGAPETVRREKAGPGIRTRIEKTEGSSRRNVKAITVSVLILVAAVVGVYLLLTERVDTVGEQLGSVSAEFEDLSEWSNETTEALGAKLRQQEQVIGAVEPKMKALLAEYGGQVKEIEKQLREKNPDLGPTLREAAKSVYIVIYRDPKGNESNCGTAWVVADGVLATNAHVAEQFLKRAKGQRHEALAGFEFLARSPGPDAKDFLIESGELHPGWESFKRVWRKHRPARYLAGGRVQLVAYDLTPCDVALLRVKKSDGFGKPLPVASDKTLEALAAGQVIGFVGYPTEAMFMHGVNLKSPSPTSQVNIVTAVTDYLLRPADHAEAFLIQHGLPLAGGASGSPILNENGDVVALVNAGNVARDAAGRRISTGVGVNFAVRSDLVRELLAGTAVKRNEKRLPRWKTQVKSHASIRDAIRKETSAARSKILKQMEHDLGAAPKLIRETWLWIPRPKRAKKDAPEDGSDTLRFVNGDVGTYAAFVHSPNIDKFLFKVELEGGGWVNKWRARMPAGLISWGTSAGGEAMVLSVEGKTDTEVKLHIYHFPRAKKPSSPKSP